MKIREYYEGHKKRLLLAAVGLLALLTAGMVVRGRQDGQKYLTAKTQRGDIMAAVQATGTINPLTTVPVGSYVSGTVQYIFADFNTRVSAGQVLAQLDPAIYEAQVMQARGNVARAEADVKNLEASLLGMQGRHCLKRRELGPSEGGGHLLARQRSARHGPLQGGHSGS